MHTTTQFDHVLQTRLQGQEVGAQVARRRWRIWTEQQRQGLEPCFGTAERDICQKTQCRWRSDCLALRAEWRR